VIRGVLCGPDHAMDVTALSEDGAVVFGDGLFDEEDWDDTVLSDAEIVDGCVVTARDGRSVVRLMLVHEPGAEPETDLADTSLDAAAAAAATGTTAGTASLPAAATAALAAAAAEATAPPIGDSGLEQQQPEEDAEEFELDRTDRQRRAWGEAAQAKIAATTVLLSGAVAGGMAEMAKNLALIGVRSIDIAPAAPPVDAGGDSDSGNLDGGCFLASDMFALGGGLGSKSTPAARMAQSLAVMNPGVALRVHDGPIPDLDSQQQQAGAFTLVIHFERHSRGDSSGNPDTTTTTTTDGTTAADTATNASIVPALFNTAAVQTIKDRFVDGRESLTRFFAVAECDARGQVLCAADVGPTELPLADDDGDMVGPAAAYDRSHFDLAHLGDPAAVAQWAPAPSTAQSLACSDDACVGAAVAAAVVTNEFVRSLSPRTTTPWYNAIAVEYRARVAARIVRFLA
jgi:hypothetical protein